MLNEQELADFCKILSVDTRVKILNLLKNQALCVGALTARLNVTQGAISQHLRILKSAGLVRAEKRGYFIHYSINEEILTKKKAAIEHFLESGRKAKPRRSKQEKSKGGKECVMRRRDVKSPRS